MDEYKSLRRDISNINVPKNDNWASAQKQQLLDSCAAMEELHAQAQKLTQEANLLLKKK